MIKKVQETGHFLLLLARDFPRRSLLLAALAGALIVSVYLSPGDNKIQPILIVEPITIALDSAPTVKEENHLQLTWQEHLVGRGDNLSTLFSERNFQQKMSIRFLHRPTVNRFEISTLEKNCALEQMTLDSSLSSTM